MLFNKKKNRTSEKPKEPAKITLELPEGYPLTKVFVTEKKLHEVRICLHSLLRNGMLGPNEQTTLKSVFGKSIAAFEAKELLDLVNEKLK